MESLETSTNSLYIDCNQLSLSFSCLFIALLNSQTLGNHLSVFKLFRYPESVVQVWIVKLKHGLKLLLEKNFQAAPTKMYSRMVFSYASMIIFPSNSREFYFYLELMHRLINKLQPGSVPKICTSGGGFKLRENVSAFRKFFLFNEE